MSLLLLKTKDLTWQDHTLNIEVMLAPTRSQLLLNKHKTLSAKSQKMKELYERQRATCIKDYVLEKRLMERYRRKLGLRMHEIAEIARTQSARERKVGPEPVEDRQLSAPVTRQRATPADVSPSRGRSQIRPPLDEQKSVKFFITESGTLASMLPRLAAASGPKDKRRKHRHRQQQQQQPREDSPEPPARSKTVTFSVPTRSGFIEPHPPRQDPHPRSAPIQLSYGCSEVEAGGLPKAQRPLDTKVAAFLEDVKKFNEEPPTPTPTPVDILTELGLKKASPPPPPPVVAKRYTNLKMETEAIETAFDEFCRTKDREELCKAMKLSSKLRSRTKVARNQSIVPSIAAFKATRSFKAIISPKVVKDDSLPKVPE